MNRSVIRTGVIAGVLGAAAVALWFLVVDVLAGRFLYTPTVLGDALLSVLGPDSGDGTAVNFIAYTIFHWAAFIVVGIIAAAAFRLGERQPAALAGIMILFVAIQLAFYGFTALIAEGRLFGGLAWYQVGLANLFAAVVMGGYLLRAYPRAVQNLRTVLEGGE